MLQLALAMLLVAVVGLIAGGIAFGFGPLPTLSGSVLSVSSGLFRILLAWAYVVTGVAGLCAIGMLFSTFTDSAPAAIVATVGVAIASQLLDSISRVAWLHPYLFSHQWLAFADLFRSPIYWNRIIDGLWLAVIYTTVFLAAAIWRFSRKDVQS
jgi:ABC-2 type transport system permease protein